MKYITFIAFLIVTKSFACCDLTWLKNPRFYTDKHGNEVKILCPKTWKQHPPYQLEVVSKYRYELNGVKLKRSYDVKKLIKIVKQKLDKDKVKFAIYQDRYKTKIVLMPFDGIEEYISTFNNGLGSSLKTNSAHQDLVLNIEDTKEMFSKEFEKLYK